MTEEHITEQRAADGTTHTTTTVIRETDPPGKGAGPWLVIVTLVGLAIIGLLVFSQFSQSEIAKDTAVAEAANKVGAAAEQVGDAAQDAADEIAN